MRVNEFVINYFISNSVNKAEMAYSTPKFSLRSAKLS